jgi:hypothetical protein
VASERPRFPAWRSARIGNFGGVEAARMIDEAVMAAGCLDARAA